MLPRVGCRGKYTAVSHANSGSGASTECCCLVSLEHDSRCLTWFGICYSDMQAAL